MKVTSVSISLENYAFVKANKLNLSRLVDAQLNVLRAPAQPLEVEKHDKQ